MDIEQFRNAVLAELDAVYRLAYHLARQPQEADDFVQETYLRAFKSADSYRASQHGVRPWLFKILHNVIHTRLAQELRQREVLDELGHHPVSAPSEAAPVADLSQIDWERIDERLKAAIGELPLPQRTAFLLCAVEDMSYREIAEVTDVPIGTVMSRLYRARTALAERLAALATERGMGREQKEVSGEFGRSL